MLLAAAALALVTALFASPASAQMEPEFFEKPFAPGQWNIGRRLDQSEFRYCVDPRDPAWEVDGAIAEAIAQGLLLQPKRFVVKSEIVLEDLTKVYGILLKDCDVYMGFKLIPEGYPNWVTVSRAYYDEGYVYVSADPAIHALGDLKPGHAIGVTIGTMAHFRLISYNLALPADKRWPIYPYGTNELALKSLLDGATDLALVWATNLWTAQRQDPAYASLHVVDPAPLPPTNVGVGGLMLEKNTFLRSAMDEAIVALTADGTIQSILDRYKYPATAKP
jgi:polar amino acid transport system substrate-binding protein